MKSVYLASCLLLFVLCCHAQPVTSNPLGAYLFEKFSEGNVLMKNGTVEDASLNYNTADQSIVFAKDENTVLTLTGLEAIDTIYFQHKKFIPGPDGLVYEVIMENSPKISLLATYSNKLTPATAVTDQSGTTHKKAAEVSNTITGSYVLRPYQGDYLIEIQQNFWLVKARQLYKANSEKQFFRVFPHQDGAIKKYIADNQVNFKVAADMVRLTLFCNGLL